MELQYLISTHLLMTLYISTKFQEKSQRVSWSLSRCDLHTEIYEGHNSIKSVGGVTVLVLFTSSDNALYLYQALSKYLIRVSGLQA